MQRSFDDIGLLTSTTNAIEKRPEAGGASGQETGF